MDDELARWEARARELLEAMHDAVVRHTFGWENQEALGELRRLAREVEAATPGASGLHQKLAAVLAWADILYSAQRHQQWGVDGATIVRGLVLNAVGGAKLALGIHIHALQRARRGGEPGAPGASQEE